MMDKLAYALIEEIKQVLRDRLTVGLRATHHADAAFLLGRPRVVVAVVADLSECTVVHLLLLSTDWRKFHAILFNVQFNFDLL